METDADAASRLWCHRPPGLVAPRRLDPTGSAGPTRGQVRSGRWLAVAPRWYVPTAGRPTTVEQRILEQGHRVLGDCRGAVTGWAALRWQGAAYFDGRGPGGDADLPVPLLAGATMLRAHPASVTSRVRLASYDRHLVAGIPVTTPLRALFDEVVARGELWEAVVAVSMVLAAGLVDIEQLATYAYRRTSWTGIQLFRDAWPLATARARSAREAWLLCAWRDADLPEPLVNEPVFDLDERLIGVPDLFDPRRGLAGEYQGAYHWQRPGQRGRDLARGERFRAHHLTPVEVAQGDTRGGAVTRLRSAWNRRADIAPSRRTWTLDQPDWWKEREERDAEQLRRERGPWPPPCPPLPALPDLAGR
ncbi:hypothetical protein [Nocardioides nanhaiensis]|uniref:Uncharacterized protein n=1 Tax=Nocardioides nanhaiensis TaxID=1476871 RepID=A0ABP8VV84_9ACTN